MSKSDLSVPAIDRDLSEAYASWELVEEFVGLGGEGGEVVGTGFGRWCGTS